MVVAMLTCKLEYTMTVTLKALGRAGLWEQPMIRLECKFRDRYIEHVDVYLHELNV